MTAKQAAERVLELGSAAPYTDLNHSFPYKGNKERVEKILTLSPQVAKAYLEALELLNTAKNILEDLQSGEIDVSDEVNKAPFFCSNNIANFLKENS